MAMLVHFRLSRSNRGVPDVQSGQRNCHFIIALALYFGVSYSMALANDFASQVVSYIEGVGVGSDFISGDKFNNPSAALGRPTVDTTGDGFFLPFSEPIPVVPIFSPYRAFELVTVGRGGSLTLKFDHQVLNDPQNPFGIDLIVFGNASLSSDDFWINRNPGSIKLGSELFDERSLVSVSRDGLHFFPFTNGPFADSFAPTLGRVFDPLNPDKSIGEFNLWWGKETDATLPLDPTLGPGDFDGKSVAETAAIYGRSAGGAGFDIGSLGLDWIEYVRIDNPEASAVTPEVDAIADVAAVPEPGFAIVAALGSLLFIGQRRRP